MDAEKLSSSLATAGFESVDISTMGGFGAVIYDMAMALWSNTRWRYLFRFLRPVFALMEQLNVGNPEKVTTGYFVIAHKRSG